MLFLFTLDSFLVLGPPLFASCLAFLFATRLQEVARMARGTLEKLIGNLALFCGHVVKVVIRREPATLKRAGGFLVSEILPPNEGTNRRYLY